MPSTNPPRIPAQAVAALVQNGMYPWWYPPGARGMQIDYFVYGTDYTPLGAGLTVANNINIDGSSAFCILSGVIVESAVDNLTYLGVPPLLVTLQDTGSNRNLSNTSIHASNWFGTAQLPKYWDVPKVLAPNATFQVTAQNLDTTTDRNVRFAFHGFKIFGFRP